MLRVAWSEAATTKLAGTSTLLYSITLSFKLLLSLSLVPSLSSFPSLSSISLILSLSLYLDFDGDLQSCHNSPTHKEHPVWCWKTCTVKRTVAQCSSLIVVVHDTHFPPGIESSRHACWYNCADNSVVSTQELYKRTHEIHHDARRDTGKSREFERP